MSHYSQADYNCLQKTVLLIEGRNQIYRISSLKQPVTLQTMIPLSNEPLGQQSTKFFEQLSKLQKQKYESWDIWKCLLSLNSTDLIKCLICYGISSSAFLLYSIVSLYLFEVMYEQKQALKFEQVYWLVLMLCSVWFYQTIFMGMGYNLLVIITNNSKRIIFYSIYVRLIAHQSSTLKGEVKGKVLNTLTEFNDLFEDCSWLIIELLSSIVPISGILVILFMKLGSLGLLFVCFLTLIMVFQYFYSDYNSRHLKVVARMKDKRMSYLSETVSFLKYIKMQGWQSLFLSKISRVRGKEFNSNIKYGAGNGIQQVIESCQLLPLIIIILFIAKNFTTMQINSKLIALITLSLSMLQKSTLNTSLTIKSYFQFSILFQRVTDFLNLEFQQKVKELKQQNKIEKKSEYVISINQMTYAYLQNKIILDKVSLKVTEGEFVTIIGQIGSGKTTLLDCIFSQITTVRESISIKKQLIYLEQEAAIFSGLLRNNIILDIPYDQQYYNYVVEFCCLNEDFSMLQNRDLTYIQEKLTNLSGGQKARIALARALYSKSKVLLLDDPLSSLDVKVGQKIYNNLMRLCQVEGYTILMTLHQINFITQSNKIYILQDSKLHSLNYAEINELHFRYNEDIRLSKSQAEQTSDQLSQIDQDMNDNLSEMKSVDLHQYTSPTENSDQHSFLNTQTRFVKDYLNYLFNCRANYFYASMTAITYIVSQIIYISTFQILGKYDELRRRTQFQTFTTYIVMLGLLVCVYLLVIWARVFFLNVCVQHSNKQIFKDMTYSLLKGSMAYYTGKSSGVVLDKYAVDLAALDTAIIFHTEQQLNIFFNSITNFMYLIIYKPVLVIFLVLLFTTGYMFHTYCAPAVIAQRQESLLHKGAPIITHFEQTIKGLKTIQSYNLQQAMKEKMRILLQNSNKACLSYHKTLNSYLVYSKHLSNIIITALFFAVVKLSQNNLKKLFYPSLALFDISWGFYFMFAETLNISSVLVSRQRISNFISEISRFKDSINLHISEHPNRQKYNTSQTFSNAIQIRNLTLFYNHNSQPALKNISLTIQRGKKVAIVGRTGSGKSSFVQALYRLVQPESSSHYLINGQNALQKSLQELRSHFSCIPQQPFIFNDTIRKNIDPFGLYSNKQIESALSKLNLLDIIKNSEKGLNSSVEHRQISFSYGESQLICLARVILQKKQIIVMDEAGSNVDEKTDAIIKSVISEQFKDRTLITIAHKLLTILDYDMILVFDKGQIVERGTAIELINRRRRVFYQMIEENPQIAQRSYRMLGIQSPKKTHTQ